MNLNYLRYLIQNSLFWGKGLAYYFFAKRKFKSEQTILLISSPRTGITWMGTVLGATEAMCS